ncbi:hypothetical protein T03_6816 [Trichinella britovi]|uniref:Uncharacterized protein n=1 Tax=Trichinella britovi TaxID=45882 RepID=A0A0V1DBK0_TRIBR|nr:hypothetical protein T03_7665 [Trichinella britovi]KRY58387.1 hypothetical protein T03_6816 [Trichinella britovi]
MLLSLFSAINRNYTDLRQPGNVLFCNNIILTKAEHTAQSKLKLQSTKFLSQITMNPQRLINPQYVILKMK